MNTVTAFGLLTFSQELAKRASMGRCTPTDPPSETCKCGGLQLNNPPVALLHGGYGPWETTDNGGIPKKIISWRIRYSWPYEVALKCPCTPALTDTPAEAPKDG